MLNSLFFSKNRADLIGWLFTHIDERYYVRQLAAILHQDSTNLSRELAGLAEAGLLTVKHEGRQKYYQADSNCPIFPEHRALAVKTFGIGDRLRSALRPFRDRICLAFIFGSFAEGRAGAGSDIDLLVIGNVSSLETIAALSPVQNTLGREINATIFPPDEFQAGLAGGNHFLQSLMEAEKIFLIGNKDELSRLAEKRLAD